MVIYDEINSRPAVQTYHNKLPKLNSNREWIIFTNRPDVPDQPFVNSFQINDQNTNYMQVSSTQHPNSKRIISVPYVYQNANTNPNYVFPVRADPQYAMSKSEKTFSTFSFPKTINSSNRKSMSNIDLINAILYEIISSSYKERKADKNFITDKNFRNITEWKKRILNNKTETDAISESGTLTPTNWDNFSSVLNPIIFSSQLIPVPFTPSVSSPLFTSVSSPTTSPIVPYFNVFHSNPFIAPVPDIIYPNILNSYPYPFNSFWYPIFFNIENFLPASISDDIIPYVKDPFEEINLITNDTKPVDTNTSNSSLSPALHELKTNISKINYSKTKHRPFRKSKEILELLRNFENKIKTASKNTEMERVIIAQKRKHPTKINGTIPRT